ncbi:Hypothetical predicted protein [Pelobates cultripes]|uniref:Uncharacterized protein n=1 Tax=Pelobates cultripes TaxID=61616 RepID=A0AAD1W761_PELCU|nr:Hypothetical predicted protein [Pelobates cultripes]
MAAPPESPLREDITVVTARVRTTKATVCTMTHQLENRKELIHQLQAAHKAVKVR